MSTVHSRRFRTQITRDRPVLGTGPQLSTGKGWPPGACHASHQLSTTQVHGGQEDGRDPPHLCAGGHISGTRLAGAGCHGLDRTMSIAAGDTWVRTAEESLGCFVMRGLSTLELQPRPASSMETSKHSGFSF